MVAVIGGVLVSIAGELLADMLMRSLNVPDDGFLPALMYLRIFLLRMQVYNFETAIFRSIGDTKNPLLPFAVSEIFSMLYEVISGYLRGFGFSLVSAILTMVGVCGVRIT